MFYFFYFSEIRFAISSQVKYSIQAFWGVSIRELHMSLWRPWSELRNVNSTKDSLIVDSKHIQEVAIDLRYFFFRLIYVLSIFNVFFLCRNQLAHNERTITLKSPGELKSLGAPPRLNYPLVLFLIKDTDTEDNLHSDETVSCIILI